MRFLSWHRVAANHHELRDVDGAVWADVQPYADGRKGQMQARAIHPDLPRATTGLWWTTGANVKAARNNIVRWMERYSAHTEGFEVVPADEQQDRQESHDDAQAAVAEAIAAANAEAEAAKLARREARDAVKARRAARAAAQLAFAF